MNKEEIEQLENLLEKLQSIQICGKSCCHNQSCEYGVECNYGSSCAIDLVLDGMRYDKKLEV